MIHIKEVAKQTQITVRTLRYYDQIGLLSAPSKTEGGHRLYSEEELKKLQYIHFFKRMGYKLQEIKDMLSDPEWDWSTGLKSQLAFILEEQKRLRSMELSLRELINGIAVEGGNEPLAVQKLIQLSNQHKKGLPDLKEHQLKAKDPELWAKLPKMNGEDPDSLEWIALLGQIKRLIKGDPASLKVQNIIRRMAEKQGEQFGDEEQFVNELWEIRKSPKQSEQLGLYPIEQETLDFMEQAFQIYLSAAESDISKEETNEQ